MANIRDLLKNIMQAIYGKDVRQSIHDAIEQCYTDAGNLAEENTRAAQTAYNAAGRADQATDSANRAAGSAVAAAARANSEADRAEVATSKTDEAITAAYDIASTLEEKLVNGEFVGPQGIQGRPGIQGPQGEAGIMTPLDTFFALSGDPEGNLWAYYNETDVPPNFSTDEAGNIFMEVG